jgi:hypothetical protein
MGVCFIDPSPEWISFFHDWAKKAGVIEDR